MSTTPICTFQARSSDPNKHHFWDIYKSNNINVKKYGGFKGQHFDKLLSNNISSYRICIQKVFKGQQNILGVFLYF